MSRITWSTLGIFMALTAWHAPALAQTNPASPKSVKLIQVVYPVADLVIPIDMDGDNPKTAKKTLEKELIDLICNTISPQSWDGRGGAGSIQYFPTGISIVVDQTEEIHADIRQLLAALRRLQDVQVAVEIRLVQVSDRIIQDMGDLVVRSQDGVAELTDCQVLKLMQRALRDRKSSVLQTPRITVFNGQKGSLNIVTPHTYVTGMKMTKKDGRIVISPKKETIDLGFKASLRPVLSGDRREVRLNLNLSMSSVDSPGKDYTVVLADSGEEQEVPLNIHVRKPRIATFGVERALRIPSGRTAVIEGQLKNGSGKNSRRLLILVTPQVIVAQEAEQPLPGPPTRTVPAYPRGR
jgi:general secretion pathway protein D